MGVVYAGHSEPPGTVLQLRSLHQPAGYRRSRRQSSQPRPRDLLQVLRATARGCYRVTEQTVVRAGFGISYEPFTNNQYALNFPVRQNQGTNQSPNGFALPTFSNGLVGVFPNGFPA